MAGEALEPGFLLKGFQFIQLAIHAGRCSFICMAEMEICLWRKGILPEGEARTGAREIGHKKCPGTGRVGEQSPTSFKETKTRDPRSRGLKNNDVSRLEMGLIEYWEVKVKHSTCVVPQYRQAQIVEAAMEDFKKFLE